MGYTGFPGRMMATVRAFEGDCTTIPEPRRHVKQQPVGLPESLQVLNHKIFQGSTSIIFQGSGPAFSVLSKRSPGRNQARIMFSKLQNKLTSLHVLARVQTTGFPGSADEGLTATGLLWKNLVHKLQQSKNRMVYTLCIYVDCGNYLN